MKNRLIKALSILTVLAMLTAFLPAALSEGSEADVQETPVLREAPAPEEMVREEAEPAPATAEEPAPIPAAMEEPAPAPAAVEEPAPAPAAEEEPAPVPEAEEPVPAEAEEEVSAPEEEGEPAPEDGEESAAEAEEELPVPGAGEEPADPDAENEEPVALNVGETLSGTVFAGKELKIRLRSENAGTVTLTLTMNAGRNISARINGTDAGFTGVETEDADKEVYTCGLNAGEDACYMVMLSAETDTDFSLEAASEPIGCTEELPAETRAETKPAAEEEPADSEPLGEEAADEEPENSPTGDPEAEEEENGFVRVMVIRENGTNLYNSTDPDAEAVGKLNHGDIYWIKAVGGIWGEIVTEDGDGPLYLNLNNVVLLRGEAGYDIPIRTVRLVSTLDGLTEIEEGTEITITAEFSGFMEDEIADITWQYRSGEEEDFRTVDDAAGLVYTYAVTEENIHNEWRIVLTLRS